MTSRPIRSETYQGVTRLNFSEVAEICMKKIHAYLEAVNRKSCLWNFSLWKNGRGYGTRLFCPDQQQEANKEWTSVKVIAMFGETRTRCLRLCGSLYLTF